MSTSNELEFRRGWPIVVACFGVAIFAWGFGFYGQAVYVAELRRLHGWPTAVISAATTCYYLVGALLIPLVHRVVSRFGPRLMLLAGIASMGAGACLFSRATAPWQMFAAGLLMAAGWACSSTTAIATTLALWFESRRSLAISLALNGASASGFTVAPLLLQLSHRSGLPVAVPEAVLAGLVLLVPIILLCIGRTPVAVTRRLSSAEVNDERPGFAGPADALRNRAFWSMALPFAVAVAAQVGFIVHMVAFLLPRLGPAGTSLAVSCSSIAAMAGRLGLGMVIDRLHERRVSAVSFASQACGLALMLAWPTSAAMLYLGSVLFGLSVGNVITLPAILAHREFAGRSFGLVVGLSSAIGQFSLALAPGVFGVLHDATGGYAAMLGSCMALQLSAAVMILVMGRARAYRRTRPAWTMKRANIGETG